jgi:uncharacterized protein
MRAIALVFAALAALIAAPVSAQEFPALSGRVVDQANIIPDATEAELTAKLETLEQTTQRQLVVVTLADLQGYDIADYGYQLGRNWGIGDAERNDGALLIVAPNDKKVRIEVGYGLEGYLTDAVSSLIINNAIVPRFREGDMPGGIVAGTDAIITQLQLPPEEAAKIAAEASQKQEQDGGFPVGAIIWLAFILFFFILPIIRGGARRRKYHSGLGRTVGDIILWEVGTAIARSVIEGGKGGGGGGGWGGGGGGGFSGGGGSFGGGGASGGW